MRQPQQVPAYEIVDIDNTSEGDSSTKSELCRTDAKTTATKNKCHKVKAASSIDERIRRPQALPQDYISPVSVSDKQSTTKCNLSTSRHGNKVAVHKAKDDENTYQPLVPSKEGADRSEYQSTTKCNLSTSRHGNKVAVHKTKDDENTYQPLVLSKEGADRSEYLSLMKNKQSKSSHIPPALPPKPEIKH